jgi:hypothetical protein
MKHDIWFPSHFIAIYDMMDIMEWLPRNNQFVAPIDLDPQLRIGIVLLPSGNLLQFAIENGHL